MYSIYKALDIEAVDKYTNHTAIIVGAPKAAVPVPEKEIEKQESSEAVVEVLEETEPVEETVKAEKPAKKTTRKKSKE